MLRGPINCDPYAGPTCLPGTPRRTTRSSMTAIDMFAGAGGFTTGAEKAGAQVLWAINHFREAIAAHAVNHPHTTHCCEDVFRFDWRQAPLSDLILASPSCKCHSTAATGGQKRGRRHTAPHNDRLRATPEAVIAAVHRAYYDSPGAGRRQPIVVMENVPEFRNWILYEPQILFSLHRMGYATSEHVIDALDLGVPSRRRRLFLIAVPGKVPFDLKLPKARKPATISKVIQRKPPAGQPWIPLEDYPSEGVIRKAKEQLGRIRTRLKRKKVPEYWIWTYTTETNPIMPDQPFRTVTAEIGGQTYVMRSRGRKHWIRLITPGELRDLMGFPKRYKLPTSPSLAGQLVGNAVCPPVSELIVRQLIERA